jgi:hypothetical protein
MFAWFFLSALYLQLVLGYTPMQVGLAFLPANLIMGAFSLGLSARLVTRFGIRWPLAVGLGLAAIGLALLARAPVEGHFVADVLPCMVLLGIGAGMAFNPVLLAAMSDVAPSDSGLASGLVNTSFMMGGALGLAVLASLAAARTEDLLASGAPDLLARNGGYQLAFLLGAVFAAAAALLGGLLLRSARAPAQREQGAIGTTAVVLKPDVILFGEMIPPDALRRSRELVGRAAGGGASSASVGLVAGLASVFGRRRSQLAEISVIPDCSPVASPRHGARLPARPGRLRQRAATAAGPCRFAGFPLPGLLCPACPGGGLCRLRCGDGLPPCRARRPGAGPDHPYRQRPRQGLRGGGLLRPARRALLLARLYALRRQQHLTPARLAG